jgi:hypothetical protein
MDYRGSMVAHVALPAAWGLNTTRRYPIGMVSVNHVPSGRRPDKRQKTFLPCSMSNPRALP